MISPTDAIQRLDAWLETMRGPAGYGGPVAHWWQQCFRFTGSAADWRYEGIILGYLRLWQRTAAEVWLDRACRAADDVAALALPSGGYRNSSFELNPAPFGTPHEAACDVALLRLALALRAKGQRDAAARRYADIAARNLRQVYAGMLWDPVAGAFRDLPSAGAFVPNKQATAAEAWLALAEWEDAPALSERYALPCLRAIGRAQVQSGPYLGAIDQILTATRQGWKPSGRYFPLYIARCLPALVQGAKHFGDHRFADAATMAACFVAASVSGDGSLSLLRYCSGKERRDPVWVAALGDVLGGLAATEQVAGPPPPTSTQAFLLAGQDVTGGIRTAHGFARILGPWRPDDPPEFRDLLHVAGWNDKALRYLAELADPSVRPMSAPDFLLDTPCSFHGRRLRFLESPLELRLEQAGRTIYYWRKGTELATIAEPWLDVR